MTCFFVFKTKIHILTVKISTVFYYCMDTIVVYLLISIYINFFIFNFILYYLYYKLMISYFIYILESVKKKFIII